MSNSRSLGRVAAAATAIVITSATAASAANATGPVFSHQDSGRTVHISRGTVFTLKLKTCADCGDYWRWKHRPNHHIVKQLSKRVVSHVKPPEVGGMATTVYKFKVVGTGTTRLVLIEKGPGGRQISHFRLTEVTPRH